MFHHLLVHLLNGDRIIQTQVTERENKEIFKTLDHVGITIGELLKLKVIANLRFLNIIMELHFKTSSGWFRFRRGLWQPGKCWYE